MSEEFDEDIIDAWEDHLEASYDQWIEDQMDRNPRLFEEFDEDVY